MEGFPLHFFFWWEEGGRKERMRNFFSPHPPSCSGSMHRLLTTQKLGLHRKVWVHGRGHTKRVWWGSTREDRAILSWHSLAPLQHSGAGLSNVLIFSAEKELFLAAGSMVVAE